MRSIFLLIVLGAVSSALVQAPSKAIASRNANGMTVTITNESGKLHEGKNNICVSFQAVEGVHPADVRNVAIEFTLLVGRNSRAAKAPLIQDADHYCGVIDLGRQFYSPANYDAVVRYVDSLGKKRRISFGLSLR
jgi:hypothetical protein